MCALINPIIAKGGTTAYTAPYSPEGMISKHIENPKGVSCQLAFEGARLLGFQSLFWGTKDALPYLPDADDWAIIATFADIQAQGKGVGKALFAMTRAKAIAAGVVGIDATIRADNTGGLAYYSRLGFQDFHTTPNTTLADGTVVDRVHKILKLEN